MPRINANRDAVDDRFSVLGFTIRTESPLYEVAVSTDPALFRADARARRNRRNFYSSRAQGVLRAPRGEAVYLLPQDVLANFVGQPKLYFGLATYRETTTGQPDYVQAPSDAHVFVNISGLTERGVRRATSGTTLSSYGTPQGRDASLEWGGDNVAGAASAATAPAKSAVSNAVAAVNASTPGQVVAASLAYDDGFGAFPEHAPAPRLSQAQEVLLRSYDGTLASQIRLFAETVQWVAGVADTTRLPHSAICQVQIYNGNTHLGSATAFYIGRNLLMTNAHVVNGATKLVVIPGKNGSGTGSANEPFGRFEAPLSDATRRVYPGYTPGHHDFDMAVVRVPVAAPGGLWLSPVEELTQSRPEGVAVCGYSARSRRTDVVADVLHAVLDPEKQHVHRGYVRAVENDILTYDVQELRGSSGSPVYWIETGATPRVHVVGVNAGPRDATTNEGCRLTPAKVAWLRARVTEWGLTGQALSLEDDSAPWAGAMEVPLTPAEGGGRSITEDVLQPGDIIVSTANAVSSYVIRGGTLSAASHVILYAGSGTCIEAVGNGVRAVPVAEALRHAILAVAYRHPHMTPAIAQRIVAHASSRIGNPYNVAGVVFAGVRIVSPLRASIIDAIARRLGREVGQAGAVYCSELVFESYRQGGLPLGNIDPARSTPQDAVRIAREQLGYVGHLRAEDAGWLGVQLHFPTQLGLEDEGESSGAYAVATQPAQGDYNTRGETHAQALTIDSEDVQRAQRYAPAWADLFNWRTPGSVVSGLSARNMRVQTIDSAHGSLNLDKYEVTISRLPTGHTAATLYNHVRTHINDFLDTRNSEFIPYTVGTDDVRWNSANPVGTVFKIDIAGPDNAAVVASMAESMRWRFTTIHTEWSGDHPVSGHREFGVRTEGSNTIFYTRASDRATDGVAEFAVWAGADQLWRSLQTKLAAWVNANGGAATIPPRFSERFHPRVVSILFGGSTAQSLGNEGGADTRLHLLPPPSATVQQPLSEGLAVPAAAVEIASVVAGAVMERITSSQGDITVSLDQLRGLKHPRDVAPANPAQFQDGAAVRLVDWPKVTNYLGDEISAGFEIHWQYNGTSLGNVQVSTIRTNDAFGWKLNVTARIMDDNIVYPANNPTFAALRVRLDYTFSRAAGTDVLAHQEVHLFGNGRVNVTHEWTQSTTFALAAPEDEDPRLLQAVMPPTTAQALSFTPRSVAPTPPSATLRAALAANSGLRRAVLDLASRELGVREEPNPSGSGGPTINSDREGRIVMYLTECGVHASQGAANPAYCAAFVTTILRQAGYRGVAGSASCTNLRGQFEAAHRFQAVDQTRPYDPARDPRPQPGDLYFKGSYGHETHVGIVVSVDDNGTLHTLEGNTWGAEGESVQGVMERTIRASHGNARANIVGFGSLT